MSIEFRELRTADELRPLPVLERLVWGGEFEMVSVNVLVATIDEGGMAIGAFDGGELVGAVYGFATRDPEVLHSHYLAVHPDHRGAGLGERLKRLQAEWCVAHGYTAMRWTFDPLQLANAHLNLNKLGAVGIDYRIDLYGSLGGINGSLASDRLVVRWDLVEPPARGGEECRVTVPDLTTRDIETSSPRATAARLVLREELAGCMTKGWRVVAVDPRERVYTLAR